MFRTLLTVLCLSIVLGGSSLTTPARADETETPRKAAQPDRSARSNGTAAFAIYGGFGCSRTYRKVGEFPCLKSAHEAFNVPNNHFGWWWIVVPGRTHKAPAVVNPEKNVERCSVYVADGAKLRLHKEVATVAEADKLVRQLKEEGAAGAFKVCYLK